MKLVRAARPNDTKLNDKELMWLWEAITTEPNMKNRLGDRIVSLYDEWKEIKAFECLPQNSIFGVFLKGFQAYGYPVVKQLERINPDAEAEILEPLLMRLGKAFRLECCDVSTILKIRLPGELFAKQEALLFKVEEDDIKIQKNTVEVSVKSLNHAYTKASLRLQQHRRSPGGKAYDHIGVKLENNIFEPLEEVRKKSENRIWDTIKNE
jgi:hypothetical protein